jgi:hypothetical protein
MPTTALMSASASKAYILSKSHADKGIPSDVPLNQYTDCQTFEHDGHTVYYCHVVTADEFYSVKKDSINDNWMGFIVCMTLILAFLIVPSYLIWRETKKW